MLLEQIYYTPPPAPPAVPGLAGTRSHRGDRRERGGKQNKQKGRNYHLGHACHLTKKNHTFDRSILQPKSTPSRPGAPPKEQLAQILHRRRLPDQPVHLLFHRQYPNHGRSCRCPRCWLVQREKARVSPHQLGLDALDHRYGALVQLCCVYCIRA